MQLPKSIDENVNKNGINLNKLNILIVIEKKI